MIPDKFEIGEIAIIINLTDIPEYTVYNNTECEIISNYGTYFGSTPNSPLASVDGYKVKTFDRMLIVAAKNLRKKKPPQDDIESDENPKQKSSWDKCIWSPNTVKV